jgi:uncharacterized membrane protein (UPF0136 family)
MSTIPSSPDRDLVLLGIVFGAIAFVANYHWSQGSSEGLGLKVDLVVMDDFIYGEPQMIPNN